MRPSIGAESVTGGACYAHGSSASNYATDMVCLLQAVTAGCGRFAATGHLLLPVFQRTLNRGGYVDWTAVTSGQHTWRLILAVFVSSHSPLQGWVAALYFAISFSASNNLRWLGGSLR